MRSPLKVARDVQRKRFEEGLGKPIPIRLEGQVHHGWLAKLGGDIRTITLCGKIECCSKRGYVDLNPVNCPQCKAKAKVNPEILKGV